MCSGILLSWAACSFLHTLFCTRTPFRALEITGISLAEGRRQLLTPRTFGQGETFSYEYKDFFKCCPQFQRNPLKQGTPKWKRVRQSHAPRSIWKGNFWLLCLTPITWVLFRQPFLKLCISPLPHLALKQKENEKCRAKASCSTNTRMFWNVPMLEDINPFPLLLNTPPNNKN